MKTKEWIEAHPKGVNFKCSCGSTVHLDIWVEDDSLLCMSAQCWNCHKALEQYAETMLIDMAICDVIDSMIAKFQKDFNRDKKQNFIRVVK
jgi:hypothetical protein